MLVSDLKRILVFIPIVFCFYSCNHRGDGFTPLEGDLLFQDLDCGSLCNAIEKVTTGRDNRCFSHIGLVIVTNNNQLNVLEAIGNKVQLTAIDSFINRSFDLNNRPKVWVGRIDKKYQPFIKAVCDTALTFLNFPYDNAYLPDNGKYYCSEMIAIAFNKALNDSLFFRFEPMTFIDPSTGHTFPVWEQYYSDLGIEIPEGVPGINPGSMSQNSHFSIVYQFGEPDFKK